MDVAKVNDHLHESNTSSAVEHFFFFLFFCTSLPLSNSVDTASDEARKRLTGIGTTSCFAKLH